MKISHLIDVRNLLEEVIISSGLTLQSSIAELESAIDDAMIVAEKEQQQRMIDIVYQQRETIVHARIHGNVPIPMDTTARIQRIARKQQRARERAIVDQQLLDQALNSL